MDKVQLRRENLRKWVATNGVPSKEKSYFSQLIGGASSFGEKSARRLERDYKMGDMYLDTPSGAGATWSSAANEPASTTKAITTKKASSTGLPDRHASGAINDGPQRNKDLAPPASTTMVDPNDIAMLISLYAQASEAGRLFILKSARIAEKLAADAAGEAAID